MARRSRYEHPDSEGTGRRAPRARQQGLPIVPIAALVVLLGGAIVVAQMLAKTADQQEQQSSSEPAYVPFSSVAEEAPPEKHDSGGGGSYVRAPEGLADNPLWHRALEKAAEAEELFAAAKEARNAEDHAAWQEKGIAAKEAFDEAFTMTAGWEEELLAQYSDRDPQVRAIMRTRTDWQKKMTVLHKTTGR